MAVEKVIIMKYEIPVIGTFTIDEGLTCALNGDDFAYSSDIDEAKDKIRQATADAIKTKAVELQSQMNELNTINVGLIDEKYRIQPFKQ